MAWGKRQNLKNCTIELKCVRLSHSEGCHPWVGLGESKGFPPKNKKMKKILKIEGQSQVFGI